MATFAHQILARRVNSSSLSRRGRTPISATLFDDG
ncbi:MAG: hypothetical protein FD138_1511, partial [Planctomycetota bacterium]